MAATYETMNFTHVIYQPGATSIQTTVYKTPEGILRAAYTSDKPYGGDPALYPDKPVDDYLVELNFEKDVEAPDFVLATWDEVRPQLDAAEDKEFPTLWEEITEERWNTMLDILPPCRWQTVRGVEMFFISEAYASNFHEHFARLDDRYFTRRCRTSIPCEDLAEEVHKFSFLQDRKFPEGMENPVKCALCPRVLPLADTYAPGDEAICPECDTEVTGRQHPRFNTQENFVYTQQ